MSDTDAATLDDALATRAVTAAQRPEEFEPETVDYIMAQGFALRSQQVEAAERG